MVNVYALAYKSLFRYYIETLLKTKWNKKIYLTQRKKYTFGRIQTIVRKQSDLQTLDNIVCSCYLYLVNSYFIVIVCTHVKSKVIHDSENT